MTQLTRVGTKWVGPRQLAVLRLLSRYTWLNTGVTMHQLVNELFMDKHTVLTVLSKFKLSIRNGVYKLPKKLNVDVSNVE
jgi:hypothetical protein